MKALLPLIMLAILCGCATTQTASGPGQKQIAVFQAGTQPAQKFTVIRTLKDDAAEAEEDEITEEFIKQARKLGGDAIIFREKTDSGMEVVPFSFGKFNRTFLYKVDVVKFDAP